MSLVRAEPCPGFEMKNEHRHHRVRAPNGRLDKQCCWHLGDGSGAGACSVKPGMARNRRRHSPFAKQARMWITSSLQSPISSTRAGCCSLVSYCCKTGFPSSCAARDGLNPTASLITTEARPSHCLVFSFTSHARRSCAKAQINYRSGGKPRGPRAQLGSRVSFCRSAQATRAGTSLAE
jgi:hypothetical protein